MKEIGLKFPNRFKELRTEKGLTQDDVVQFLKRKNCICDPKTYREYEKGNAFPSAKTLCTLSDFFGVSTDYLLGRCPDYKTMDDKFVSEYIGLDSRTVEYLHTNKDDASGYSLLSELLCRDDFFHVLCEVEEVALNSPSIYKEMGIASIIPEKNSDFSYIKALINERFLASAINRGAVHEAAFQFESILRDITDKIMRLCNEE